MLGGVGCTNWISPICVNIPVPAFAEAEQAQAFRLNYRKRQISVYKIEIYVTARVFKSRSTRQGRWPTMTHDGIRRIRLEYIDESSQFDGEVWTVNKEGQK